jgi:transcriptional regulator with XRE-family HTH domain
MGRSVGMRLRFARKLRGLTQVELAKASGVGQASISDLETGASKEPWGTNLVSIAHTLKVSPRWLANGKGQMEADTDTPLSPEAMQVARDWEALTPEVRTKIAEMLAQLAATAKSFGTPVEDERVEAAYGKPGSKKVK